MAENEEEKPTHQLTTRLNAGSTNAFPVIIAEGEPSELVERAVLLMQSGLIDNMNINRINGQQPKYTEQISVWLNMAVMQFTQLNT